MCEAEGHLTSISDSAQGPSPGFCILYSFHAVSSSLSAIFFLVVCAHGYFRGNLEEWACLAWHHTNPEIPHHPPHAFLSKQARTQTQLHLFKKMHQNSCQEFTEILETQKHRMSVLEEILELI